MNYDTRSVIKRRNENNSLKKNTYRLENLFIWLGLLMMVSSCTQSKKLLNRQKISKDSITFFQIKSDTLFDSQQLISVLLLPQNASKNFEFKFVYNQSDLMTTSTFAKKNNAEAAINAGFFDMDQGGGVTYFELNDSVITKTRDAKIKWGVPDSIINGAVLLANDFDFTFEPAKSEQFYKNSKQGSAVMVTGPLLLLNARPMKLPDMRFSNHRHPRTCLCKTKKSIAFINIDGKPRKDKNLNLKKDQAQGMQLKEVQEFLLSIGCIDAINLDGGGSTTMWTKEKGLVNHPSDPTGERPVANALLILKKK